MKKLLLEQIDSLKAKIFVEIQNLLENEFIDDSNISLKEVYATLTNKEKKHLNEVLKNVEIFQIKLIENSEIKTFQIFCSKINKKILFETVNLMSDETLIQIHRRK